MSLLKPSEPAHATPLKRFAASMRRKGDEERAVLQNLLEEDRVPDDTRHEFQRGMACSRPRSWIRQFCSASGVGACKLPVSQPPHAEITGPWWHHVTLDALQKYGYASKALKGSRPPRRLPLARRIGRPETGADRTFWITNETGNDADDVRDRLGLCRCMRGQQLYRIRIDLTVARRPLYIPTALDAGFYPAWRRPARSHVEPWGMTRHLGTGEMSERELLALPDDMDASQGQHVGPITSDPPLGHYKARRRS